MSRAVRSLRILAGLVALVAATSATAQSRASAAGAAEPRRPLGQTTECVILKIVDGDTVNCRGGARVRLLGIDAPERDQKPFGANAASELAKMLPLGTRTKLEQDVQAHDQYGRVLAYVWLNDTLINWRMVRDGWATLLTYAPNVRYVEALASAQRLARDDKRGLWKTNGFSCTPVNHRKKLC